jgi:hypothetical protein
MYRLFVRRVGLDRTYTLYITVCLMISLSEIRIYTVYDRIWLYVWWIPCQKSVYTPHTCIYIRNTVNIWYLWQGNDHAYRHIVSKYVCMIMVMADPIYDLPCPCFNSLHSLWILFTGYVYICMIMVMTDPTYDLPCHCCKSLHSLWIVFTGYVYVCMIMVMAIPIYDLPCPCGKSLHSLWIVFTEYV